MKKGCFFTDTCELDERQLLLRGNVFKHTTVLLFALILINAMLKEYGITWAEGRNENLMIFWAGATLGLCEFSLRGVNPASRRNNILYGFFGICGGGLLILGLLDLADGHPLVANGMLTTLACSLLLGACYLLIWLTSFCKWLSERRRTGTDED